MLGTASLYFIQKNPEHNFSADGIRELNNLPPTKLISKPVNLQIDFRNIFDSRESNGLVIRPQIQDSGSAADFTAISVVQQGKHTHLMYVRDIQNEFPGQRRISLRMCIYDGIKCCSSAALVTYRDLCYRGWSVLGFFSPGSASFYYMTVFYYMAM